MQRENDFSGTRFILKTTYYDSHRKVMNSPFVIMLLIFFLSNKKTEQPANKMKRSVVSVKAANAEWQLREM
jgi:hypothetical protein